MSVKKIAGRVAIGATATVVGTLALGAIGSVITGNPLPLLVAIKATPEAAASGAALGGIGLG